MAPRQRWQWIAQRFKMQTELLLRRPHLSERVLDFFLEDSSCSHQGERELWQMAEKRDVDARIKWLLSQTMIALGHLSGDKAIGLT